MNYSRDFSKVLSDKSKILSLLEDCYFHTDDFHHWEEERAFIAKAINQPGSILDIGSANGFLLTCFQEWQPHKLTPYGIDTDDNLIEKAKVLFPEYPDNFSVLSIENLNQTPLNFPKKFNLIFWNVWDNRDFTKPQELEILKSVLNKVSLHGRLILGLYHRDQANNQRRIQRLVSLGFVPRGILENPTGSEMACWFDK